MGRRVYHLHCCMTSLHSDSPPIQLCWIERESLGKRSCNNEFTCACKFLRAHACACMCMCLCACMCKHMHTHGHLHMRTCVCTQADNSAVGVFAPYFAYWCLEVGSQLLASRCKYRCKPPKHYSMLRHEGLDTHALRWCSIIWACGSNPQPQPCRVDYWHEGIGLLTIIVMFHHYEVNIPTPHTNIHSLTPMIYPHEYWVMFHHSYSWGYIMSALNDTQHVEREGISIFIWEVSQINWYSNLSLSSWSWEGGVQHTSTLMMTTHGRSLAVSASTHLWPHIRLLPWCHWGGILIAAHQLECATHSSFQTNYPLREEWIIDLRSWGDVEWCSIIQSPLNLMSISTHSQLEG